MVGYAVTAQEIKIKQCLKNCTYLVEQVTTGSDQSKVLRN